jgi:hypothetical protein
MRALVQGPRQMQMRITETRASTKANASAGASGHIEDPKTPLPTLHPILLGLRLVMPTLTLDGLACNVLYNGQLSNQNPAILTHRSRDEKNQIKRGSRWVQLACRG